MHTHTLYAQFCCFNLAVTLEHTRLHAKYLGVLREQGLQGRQIMHKIDGLQLVLRVHRAELLAHKLL